MFPMTFRGYCAAVLFGAVALVSGLANPARAELQPDPIPEVRVDRCGSGSAFLTFKKTWRATRRFFGAAGLASPKVRFVDDHYWAAEVEGDAVGYRAITVHGAFRDALAGMRGCREKREAQVGLIHEFAHVYQLGWVLEGEYAPDETDEGISEGCAQAFAEWAALSEFGWETSDYNEGWDVYDAYAREARSKFPAEFIQLGQFGDHWGMSPREILW
jgi:hypothetical protein